MADGSLPMANTGAKGGGGRRGGFTEDFLNARRGIVGEDGTHYTIGFKVPKTLDKAVISKMRASAVRASKKYDPAHYAPGAWDQKFEIQDKTVKVKNQKTGAVKETIVRRVVDKTRQARSRQPLKNYDINGVQLAGLMAGIRKQVMDEIYLPYDNATPPRNRPSAKTAGAQWESIKATARARIRERMARELNKHRRGVAGPA